MRHNLIQSHSRDIQYCSAQKHLPVRGASIWIPDMIKPSWALKFDDDTPVGCCWFDAVDNVVDGDVVGANFVVVISGLTKAGPASNGWTRGTNDWTVAGHSIIFWFLEMIGEVGTWASDMFGSLILWFLRKFLKKSQAIKQSSNQSQ